MLLGKKIGYIRISSFGQNPERQLDGIELDKIFSDTASGKDMKRPQLESMLEFVREGDMVIIHSMDRLARNLDDLRRIVRQCTEGIALAKVRGVYRKGRKKSLSSEQINLLMQKINEKSNKSKLAREFGISRETLYQYLKKNVKPLLKEEQK